MKDVSIWNYGNYSSDNYGSCRAVSIGCIDLYFSYDTVVAFRAPRMGLVVSENCWGPTTGKHLNWIDGGYKSTRLPRDEFERQLKFVLKVMHEAFEKIDWDKLEDGVDE
jgi:hypothetical protein